MRHYLPWFAVALAGVSLAWISAPAQQKSASASAVGVEDFLPKTAFAAFHADGYQKHLPAISETAAWKALRTTELQARVFDLLQMFAAIADPEVGKVARDALDHVMANGASFAVSTSASGEGLTPYGVLVLPQSAKLKTFVDRAANVIAREEGIEITERLVEGRTISFLETPVPNAEFAWWSEADHLILTFGIDAVSQVIGTVTHKHPAITQNPMWNKLRTSKDFTVDQFGWVDARSLLDQFGDLPFPEPPETGPLSIRDAVAMFGLHNLNSISGQSGFSGAETWSVGAVDVDGELTGVLSLLKQDRLTLAELPPMPVDMSGFAATKFNLTAAWDVIINIVNDVAAKAGPEAEQQLAQGMQQLREQIGGDPRQEILPALGDLWCLYADTTSLPIPVGAAPVLAVNVGDRDKLLNGVDRLTKLIQVAAGNSDLTVRQSWKDGNLYVSVGYPGVPIFPTILVTKKWIVAGITPGSAQSFVLRENGKLPSWKPDAKVTESLAKLPAEYSSISVSDPAPGYRQLLNMAPMGLSLLETQVLPNIAEFPVEIPFGIEDIPAAELVTAPMFPNVSVGIDTPNGWKSVSRQSVPSNPIGNLSSTAAIPILVALLLPAVQQAREAARRTQSKNNLKQLGLAMHNYHDVYNQFPRGTFDNPRLKPEERMSWVVEILPYMEQQAIYEQIGDARKGRWDSEALEEVRGTTIPALQNPSTRRGEASPSSMDYVGIAGVGPDAANLPGGDPKAGIFGYNRIVRMRDITDGTSNTLMIGDSKEPNQSFLAGGEETMRGFSQKPYLNGPDRIGSPHIGIVQFLLADGSVRAISVNIDESVLEALATKAGGEDPGEF